MLVFRHTAVIRHKFHNESARRYLAIEKSELFDASYLAVGTDSLHELNYLARRLDCLSDEDAVKFAAVYAARTEEFPRDAYMQVRSAINMTYGLDAVPVASNVSNNYELGKFIVENDFDERFENIPDSVLEYLDYRAIGKSFREQDGGEFIGRCYVPTRYYETQNVYDGEHLPPPSPEQSAVFSLLVAPAPESDPDEVLDLAQWLHLPASEEQIDDLAEQLGVEKIQDSVFYEFKSGIPQIEKYMIRSMSDIEKLNKLADDYSALTAEKRTMFKAVMERGYTSTLDGAIAAFKCMDNYEFDFEAENSDDFFKKYLAYHAPTNFDNRWLDGIRSEVDADRLLQRLGATQTPYGIVSKQFGSLFALTDYFEAEKFELVEVVGQPALFSDSRISDTEVPNGLAGAVAIHGIRVMDSRKGLFVSMPNRSYKDSNGNTQYSDIAHAVTKEVREAINKQVLDAYNQALEESQNDGFTDLDDDEDLPFDEDEDGSMGFAPSM